MTRRKQGLLEAEVMALLWASDRPLTGRELEESFDDALRPARTTLLTVLTRLERKGRVRRRPAAGGALFAPTEEQSVDVADAMRRLLEQVPDRAAVLTRFVGNLDADDVSVLRRTFGG